MKDNYTLPREKKVSKWACRKLEQKTFKELAEKLDSPMLEVGPGYGILMTSLRELGKNITGLEYNPEVAIELSKQGLDVVNGDVKRMNFNNNTFNTVIIEEVIEHIFEQYEAMLEIYRVIKPGGRLLLATPNKWIYRFFMYISNIVNWKWSWELIKNPTPGHVAECTLKSLKDIHKNFEIDAIIPINPYLPKFFLKYFSSFAINYIVVSHKK